MVNCYCTCLIVGEKRGEYVFALDPYVTFPNPAKAVDATARCLARAKLLRQELAKRDSVLTHALKKHIGRFERVEPVIIRGIEEST